MHKNREISFCRGRDFISKSFTLIAFLLITQHMLGQTSDNFSDGDFTGNLVWSGSTSHFIVNTSQQLQLNNTVASTSYLSAPFAASNLNELNWEFYIKQSFASSASNFGKVYLVSDQAVLTGSLNGYYLQFGEAGTLDAIELFRQTGTTSTSVCRATSGSIANSFSVRVKVSRDNTGLWKVFVDYTGGTNLVQEASGTDVVHSTSSYFGVLCTYTLSNVNKFFFDDFSINPFVIPDTNPPAIQTATVKSSSELAVLFSEDLEEASAETISNYSVSDGIGNPASATLEADKKTVTLSFAQNFPNGIQRTIDVSGVKDLAGNTMVTEQKTFIFFKAVAVNMNDIIITELFADPAPTVGLPEVEFVEIFNRSSNPFDLDGWKITDGTSTGTLSSLILLPNEYLVLTPSSTSAQYNSHGKVMGLSIFPSLNNSGDAIVLRDAGGMKVDSVKYTSAWYLDDEKKDGGWTLERIDPEDFCKESENWIASNDASGGTPGKQNSVYSITPDNTGPKLISCVAIDPQTIHLAFDEKLSSTIPATPDFTIEPAISINGISFTDATLKTLQLTLSDAIDISTVYRISASNIFDCPGNPLQSAFNTISLKLDNTAPTVVSIELLSDKTLKISFSEKLHEAIATDVSNYLITDENISPASVSKISETVYHLEFENAFRNGVRKNIKITGLKDLSENLMTDYTSSFMYFVSRPSVHKDIIVTEIFADPAPVIGLPEAEFIEIYNRSNDPFDLNGWQITDGTSIGNLPSEIILPGEYLVLTHTSSVAKFSSNVLGLSTFPSLNNSGDAIVIKDATGLKIDSVKYSSVWYRDEEKKDGGWSLELIDPEDFCADSEIWIASNDPLGGTPGRQNSVYQITPDNLGPRLLSYSMNTLKSLELEFDEKLSISAPSPSSFSLEPAIEIESTDFMDASLRKIQLNLSQEIEIATTYTLTVTDVYDCPGNIIQPGFSRISIKLDNTLPSVVSVFVLSSTELKILFSESVDEATVTTNAFLAGTQIPSAISRLNESTYVLTFSPFINGVKNQLTVKGVKDLAGNTMTESHHGFLYFNEHAPNFKDIIITEIFADPSPVVGLPEAEFIEIFNRGQNPFDLSGWTISDGGTPSTLASKIILPNEYVIITANSSYTKFLSYGSIVTSPTFPSLNNSGDAIVLRDRTGQLIDSLHYDLTWYRDDEKKDGGWTLELIYTENTCAESENWIASESETGGTPGKQNSVAAEKPDLTGPMLISAIAVDPLHLKLQFNEKLEAATPSTDKFLIQPSVSVTGVLFADKALTTLDIELNEPLSGGVIYEITANDLYDCPGNKIDPDHNSVEFVLPEKADSLDIVINEILFNPRSTGVDFIEVYNKSSKYINLNGWALANVVEGEVVNRKIISPTDFLLKPNSYLVFTEEANVLKGEYVNGIEGRFFQVDIPSMSDDEGSVVLITPEEKIIDLVVYADHYHSVFLQDDEGVSLERLSFTESSMSSENWKSASSTVLATPGYRNSNYSEGIFLSDEQVSVEPEVFAPMSGQPDFTTIKYKFDKTGYVAGVKIIDPLGREIKQIADNELLGPEGFFRWDGDQNNGSKARLGSYMVYFEVFDERGVVKTFRKRVVIGAKF